MAPPLLALLPLLAVRLVLAVLPLLHATPPELLSLPLVPPPLLVASAVTLLPALSPRRLRTLLSVRAVHNPPLAEALVAAVADSLPLATLSPPLPPPLAVLSVASLPPAASPPAVVARTSSPVLSRVPLRSVALPLRATSVNSVSRSLLLLATA